MENEYIKIALVPAYEPDDKLIKILQDIVECGFIPFVVDDGSGKKYKNVFEEASKYASVISYPVNKGKGIALKTGITHIKEKYDGRKYVIVTLDSDGQHTAKDSLMVCDEAIGAPGTLVIGGRRQETDDVPLKSKFGNVVTRFFYRMSTGLKIRDTQTGLRAFTDELAGDVLSVAGERYEYEMNMLLEFSRKKIPIKEVEISTIYYDNNKGSHFSPLKDSARILWGILKFSASSFASFIVDFIFYSVFLLLFAKYGEKAIVISNVSARVISSVFNFTINRKYVFKSDKSLAKSAAEYFLLAMVVLVGNTFLLKALVHVMDKFAAKLVTEICFFALSYTAQRLFVFKKSRKK